MERALRFAATITALGACTNLHLFTRLSSPLFTILIQHCETWNCNHFTILSWDCET